MRHIKFVITAIFITFALVLAGCVQIESALFGESVERNSRDSSPPNISIYAPDRYIRTPTGSLTVTDRNVDAYAQGRYVSFVAIADDPDGVRYGRLEEITITPRCRQETITDGDRPPPVPQSRNGTAYTIRASQINNPPTASEISTRLPVFGSILVPEFETRQYFCVDDPALFDAPLFVGAVAEIRAAAGNYGVGGASSSGLLRIVFGSGRLSGSGPIGRPPIGGGGTPSDGTCEGEGDACSAMPDECFGRDNFSVPGTIVCRSGQARCEVTVGEDYCAFGGTAQCGGTVGDLCQSDSDCNLFSVCDRNNRCASLTIPEESSPGQPPPCTPVQGACWLPDETGNPGVRAMLCNQ